jgi:putative transposase
MKRKRFSVEQIVTILKQAEMGMPVGEVIRRVGISEQTFYRWKKTVPGIGDRPGSSCGAHCAY